MGASLSLNSAVSLARPIEKGKMDCAHGVVAEGGIVRARFEV